MLKTIFQKKITTWCLFKIVNAVHFQSVVMIDFEFGVQSHCNNDPTY